MRKLALATTALPLLLGLASVAQAGGGGGGGSCTESAILECKSTKKGGFEVVLLTNDGGSAFSIEPGDDCTEALSLLTNHSLEDFFIDEVSTGTPDRTVYTMRAVFIDGEGQCD